MPSTRHALRLLPDAALQLLPGHALRGALLHLRRDGTRRQCRHRWWVLGERWGCICQHPAQPTAKLPAPLFLPFPHNRHHHRLGWQHAALHHSGLEPHQRCALAAQLSCSRRPSACFAPPATQHPTGPALSDSSLLLLYSHLAPAGDKTITTSCCQKKPAEAAAIPTRATSVQADAASLHGANHGAFIAKQQAAAMMV